MGIDHEKLLHERFNRFVTSEYQDTFYLYCQRALNGHCCQSGEIRLVKQNRTMIYVHLESMQMQGDEENLLVMVIDITQQRELQHRLIEKREKERQKVAQDLHDDQVQALASITFAIQGMLEDYPGDELSKELQGLQERIREQIQVLRNYSVELRPPMLSNLGLEKAIQSHAETFREKHPEITLRLETAIGRKVLPESVSVAMYRIYQEVLQNVSKHALPQTTEVSVRLEMDGHLVRLEVLDNGEGFDLPDQWLEFVQDGHLGIKVMRERAEANGGLFKIQSSKGNGTHIEVALPLNNASPQPGSRSYISCRD